MKCVLHIGMMMTNGLYCIQYMRYTGVHEMFGPNGVCDDCSAVLPEWKFSFVDRREVCPQCRIARVLEQLHHHFTGEY